MTTLEDVDYQTVYTIIKDELTIEYFLKLDIIVISWETDDEDFSVIVYENKEWHLEDSPIKDAGMLERYLKLFELTKSNYI